MHHHINHCWCNAAEHNNEMYDAPNMVDIDKCEADAADWDNMIETKKVVSEEDLAMYNRIRESHPDAYKHMSLEALAERDCPLLKEDVTKWLDDNVKPLKDGEPGWAIGNDQYRLTQNHRVTVWFQRRNDAKKFIKTWSKFKKATGICNYFDDINLVLDLDTGKYFDRHSSQTTGYLEASDVR